LRQTDSSLARFLIEQLEGIGVDYAILHKQEELLSGTLTSDVDIAVDADLADVNRQIAERVRRRISPVIVWRYDVNSLTTCWSTPDASRGVQLDLLNDPEGRGRLAFKTQQAIAEAQPGQRFMELSTSAKSAYLLSKRLVKGDLVALNRVVSEITRHGQEAIVLRHLSPRGQFRARKAIAGRHPKAVRLVSTSSFRRIPQLIVRLGDPPGALLLTQDDARTDEISTGLANVAPIVKPIRSGTSVSELSIRLWTFRKAVILRTLTPDIRLNSGHVASTVEEAVKILRDRAMEQLGRLV